MKKIMTVLTALLMILPLTAKKNETNFVIADNGKVAPIVVDGIDWKGVHRAATDLADDIGKVTGIKSAVFPNTQKSKGNIIAGTIGKSKLIDGLISQGKLNVDSVKGQWESYVTEVIDGNLIIAGSDKR